MVRKLKEPTKNNFILLFKKIITQVNIYKNENLKKSKTQNKKIEET